MMATDMKHLQELLDPRPLGLRHKFGVAGLVGLGALPLFLYFLGARLAIIRLTYALYIAMFAMSWDAVSGYTGELSFGHAFFFALGGYGSAVLNVQYGLTPSLSIPLGIGLATLGGLAIGIPSLRIQGPYLALVTLIAPLLLFRVIVIFSGTLGGETGLPRADMLVSITDATFQNLVTFYISFAVFLVILGLLLLVTRSDAGVTFFAIRGGEDLVSVTGKNPAKFKVFAFVLSAAVGGGAGAFFVHTVGQATPSELVALEVSLFPILATIFGGMATIVGAAVGGLLIYFLEVSVNQIGLEIPILGRNVKEFSFVIIALVGLFIVYFLSGGIVRWSIERGEEFQDSRRYARAEERYEMVRERVGDWYQNTLGEGRR